MCCTGCISRLISEGLRGDEKAKRGEGRMIDTAEEREEKESRQGYQDVKSCYASHVWDADNVDVFGGSSVLDEHAFVSFPPPLTIILF
jgi:hypothetical protein